MTRPCAPLPRWGCGAHGLCLLLGGGAHGVVGLRARQLDGLVVVGGEAEVVQDLVGLAVDGDRVPLVGGLTELEHRDSALTTNGSVPLVAVVLRACLGGHLTA